MAVDVRPNQRDLVRGMQALPRLVPQSMRELLEFLSYYDPGQGLDRLLSTLDTTGVTPAHIYNVVHDRAPESVEFAVPAEGYDVRQHLKEALLSPDFRHNVVRNFLHAYAEKGRDIFIHVPKCAGTDLIFSLAYRSLPLPKMIETPGWISDEDFLAALAGIARIAPGHSRIFVYGHMELGGYVDAAGVRPTDRFFTIIRDPLDLVLSQANYAIGRLRQDPKGHDPDTAEILEYLGISRLPDPINNRDLKDLTIRALLDRRIAQPNRACLYLGKGMQMDYALAMTNLVTYNVEVTTTRHYQRWLQERWGINDSVRHNESEKILSRAEARHCYAGLLKPRIAQDQMLFDVVSWALAKTGKCSVTGLEIARLAGPGLLDSFPAEMRRQQEREDRSDERANAQTNLLMAQESKLVALYLEQPSVKVPGSASMRTVLDLDFGESGNARAHMESGWSRPEPRFTWTDGHAARLQIPALPPGRPYVFRLMGAPFVIKGQYESQRAELAINGVSVGTARMHDHGVIECDIPEASMSADQPMLVELQLPDAVRPSDLGHGEDHRMLGIAVRQAVILEVIPA